MRLITKEEKSKLKLKKGRNSPLRVALLNMKPGQILQLDRGDYKNKKAFYFTLRRIMRKTTKKYEYELIADGSGIVVERMK